MNHLEPVRPTTRTRSERRLTWMTAGVAAIGLASTGGFAVVAAATYAGAPQTADVTSDGTRGDDALTSDTAAVTDPLASAGPQGVAVQVTPAPTKRRHATSGGSH